MAFEGEITDVSVKLVGRPQWGEWVTASAVFQKKHVVEPIASNPDYDREITVWERIPKLIKGLYIGQRRVHDGHWERFEHNPEDDQPWFKSAKTHLVWLIVPSEWQNPVYVLPEDVECNPGNGWIRGDDTP